MDKDTWLSVPSASASSASADGTRAVAATELAAYPAIGSAACTTHSFQRQLALLSLLSVLWALALYHMLSQLVSTTEPSE